MPVEFSRQAVAMNANMVESLSYAGSDETDPIRPPGLTDLPGAASGACATAAAAGDSHGVSAGAASLAAAGLHRGCGCVARDAHLMTPQVRSMLLMTIFGFFWRWVCSWPEWVAFGSPGPSPCQGAGLTVIAFLVAYGIGGDAVFNRFYGLYENGLVSSFRENVTRSSNTRSAL